MSSYATLHCHDILFWSSLYLSACTKSFYNAALAMCFSNSSAIYFHYLYSPIVMGLVVCNSSPMCHFSQITLALHILLWIWHPLPSAPNPQTFHWMSSDRDEGLVLPWVPYRPYQCCLGPSDPGSTLAGANNCRPAAAAHRSSAVVLSEL